MWLVSVRDLQFRARRFVIAVVVTSLVFGIALAIDGMRRSVQAETPAIVALFGADRWLVAQGATGPFTTTRVLGAATANAVRQASGSSGLTQVSSTFILRNRCLNWLTVPP